MSRLPCPEVSRSMRGLLCVGVVLLGACSSEAGPAGPDRGPGSLRGVVTKAPVELIDTAVVPCSGEAVELQIREQVVTHESVDAQGTTHVHFVVNDKGTTGVGLTSGTRYRQVGATRENDRIVQDAPQVISFGNALNLIGQGSAPNLVLHETFHLTINAAGVTTVERETQRMTCR
jgi:hypothetical protein